MNTFLTALSLFQVQDGCFPEEDDDDTEDNESSSDDDDEDEEDEDVADDDEADEHINNDNWIVKGKPIEAKAMGLKGKNTSWTGAVGASLHFWITFLPLVSNES